MTAPERLIGRPMRVERKDDTTADGELVDAVQAGLVLRRGAAGDVLERWPDIERARFLDTQADSGGSHG